MNKEQQDLAWRCLPKEVRKEIRLLWELDTLPVHPDYDPDSVAEGAAYILTDIFGHHNLTSDTEPEEMLVVERKKVQSQYNRCQQLCDDKDDTWVLIGQQIASVLMGFFGDKCLPDTPNTPNSGELKPEVAEGEPNYKFSLGQKVILHFYGGEIGTISERLPPQEGNVWNCYKVKGLPHHLWLENELDAYEESRNLSQNIANCDKSEDNQLKDNMEEKELNLAELLKGCEGEKFFSPCYGNVTLSEVRNDRIIVIADVNGKKHSFVPNGSHISNPVASCVMLIPNLGLYQKYPLDARAAWMEWEEARKPKRWRAKCYDRYWGLNSMGIPENMQDIHCHDGVDQLRYEFGNYFRTEEESRQAAEAVRETLEKFHENNKQR